MSIGKTKVEKAIVCWTLMLMLGLGASCWFLGKFTKDWWTYHQLSVEAPAQASAWGIEKIKAAQFGVYAKYQFESSSGTVQGRTLFKTNFNNQVAARSHLDEWKNQSWTVYYNQKNPHMSTLQRPFPLKVLIHGLLALGVSFYFVYLKRFISTFA